MRSSSAYSCCWSRIIKMKRIKRTTRLGIPEMDRSSCFLYFIFSFFATTGKRLTCGPSISLFDYSGNWRGIIMLNLCNHLLFASEIFQKTNLTKTRTNNCVEQRFISLPKMHSVRQTSADALGFFQYKITNNQHHPLFSFVTFSEIRRR